MPAQKEISTAIDRLARKCRIDPYLVEDAYPCTSLQSALVAASLNGLGDYVSRFVFDVSSTSCSPKVIKAAWEKVYEQTAILRTRVVVNGQQFLQTVTREPLEWFEEDSLQSYLSRDRERPVALGEPLARFVWVCEPSGKMYMVWSLHHCQYDEWSFNLMLASLNAAVSGASPPRRTPFSKFIKALSKVDTAASHAFWEDKLRGVSHCRSICPKVSSDHAFRTTKRYEKTSSIHLQSNSVYQPSVLAVAAWSLLLSQLSSSSQILFGHVLSGRTSDLEGIQEICGPALATVPWCVEIPIEMMVKNYLDQLQKYRMQVLPFEQTGLAEYRKVVGTACFDSLLSVRSSQEQGNDSSLTNDIRPQSADPSDLNHPCAIFFEVDIGGDQCKMKASYDDRCLDPDHLDGAMDKFVSIMQDLPSSLGISLKSFRQSSELPASLELEEARLHRKDESPRDNDDSTFNVDAEMAQKIQKIVVSTVKDVNTDAIGPKTTLMQLGMDSLQTVLLAQQISKAFNVSVPFQEIAGPGRTLRSIARSVEKVMNSPTAQTDSAGKMSLLDMAERHVKTLSPVMQQSKLWDDGAARSGQSAILLTGATGYLGIEILRQCLAALSDQIVLLIRCENAAEGLKRVTSSAKIAAWENTEIELLVQRVQIWPSDLARERLGLSNEYWQLLDSSNSHQSSLYFKAIIHNGAKVDFLHTYADLEDANVRSTATLLDLHLRLPRKPNFILVTGGRPCPLTPDKVDDTAAQLAGAAGYAQTKFVSELLMHRTKELYQEAGEAAFGRMCIVHPGSIIGGAGTGVANADDFIWRYVAACESMNRYVPAVPTKREWINLTPVDSVASKIVSRACDTPENGVAMDSVERCLMRSGLPISRFWSVVASVLQKNGSPLKPVSEWEWIAELEADINDKGQSQPIFALSQLLLQGKLMGIGGQPPEINAKTGALPHDTAPVEAALRKNVEYLSSMGFFDGQQLSSRAMFVRSKA